MTEPEGLQEEEEGHSFCDGRDESGGLLPSLGAGETTPGIQVASPVSDPGFSAFSLGSLPSLGSSVVVDPAGDLEGSQGDVERLVIDLESWRCDKSGGREVGVGTMTETSGHSAHPSLDLSAAPLPLLPPQSNVRALL